MPALAEAHIDRVAESCVDGMGDIFWDYDADRDAPLDYTEPRLVATKAVKAALREMAETLEVVKIYSAALRLEYREIIARAGGDDDQRILSQLVQQAAWTDEGARAILHLARAHGTSTLRNALALAEAMDIEDGAAGL